MARAGDKTIPALPINKENKILAARKIKQVGSMYEKSFMVANEFIYEEDLDKFVRIIKRVYEQERELIKYKKGRII